MRARPLGTPVEPYRAPPQLVVLLASTLFFAGCTGPADERETPLGTPAPDAGLAALYTRLAASPELHFETDHGPIRLLLYTELMPQTAGRFAELARSGFYDDTLIHRVVDDFVIQGGDPSKTGLFGSGETIPHEIHPDLAFGSGAMGLARDVDPDSGDSQWFITEKPAPHLSDPDRSSTGPVFGAFALYAQVFEGMETVRTIAAVPVVPGLDRPVEDVYLQTASLLPPPTDVDLLQYPTNLSIDRGITLQRPLNLLAGHPFDVTVFVEPNDDGAPHTVTVGYGTTEAIEATVPLAPHPDDPWVFNGTITIPTPGNWFALTRVEGRAWGAETGATVEVHPWHDDYARFSGTGA